MDFEFCQPILPYPLQLNQGQVLPLPNYLELQVVHPTYCKVFTQFCSSIFHLIPMRPMPDMHVFYCFPVYCQEHFWQVIR